ncbi:MAG: cell division protein SepF [Pseudonocardiaceae bacterium]
MSALHRLKAYFGMVPAEDFDPAEFGAPAFGEHHSDYRSGNIDPGHDSSSHGHPPDHAAQRPSARRSHRIASEGYGDGGFANQSGHPAAPRPHLTRPPSWAAETWATKAPVRGSLAIDTTSTVRQSASHQHMPHQQMPQQPAASRPFTPMPATCSVAEEPLAEDAGHPLARIVTLHPHSYNEARPIGERYREGNPVIMNLTEMQDRDAKRLVDFAAGLAFALHGSIDKITNKVFLLSPPDVDVSPEDRRRIAEGRYFG